MVILEGDTTEQALAAMTAVEPFYWEWSAGVPETPAEGAVLDASTPVEFTWTSDLVDLDPPADPTPLTGVAFLLRFSSESDPTVLHVFTTESRYLPDAERWALLAGSDQPLSLRIDSADFEENAIVEGRGPFYGLTRTFSIR